MNKNVLMKKVVIALILACLMALGILSEWGLATLFHIQYNGMGYKEYAIWYFTEHPWVLYVEIAMIIAAILAWTHYEYRHIDALWEKIKAKKMK